MTRRAESRVPVALVVAIAQNDVIGRNGALPWRMASDLKWFKRITLGKPVVMGRTTYESIGKPLPGRPNVVMTRTGLDAEGVHVAASWAEADTLAQHLAREAGAQEVCVIGGAQIYALALPQVDRIYLTRIEAEVDGDTTFPLGAEGWDRNVLERIAPGPKDDHPARIERWVRADRP